MPAVAPADIPAGLPPDSAPPIKAPAPMPNALPIDPNKLDCSRSGVPPYAPPIRLKTELLTPSSRSANQDRDVPVALTNVGAVSLALSSPLDFR